MKRNKRRKNVQANKTSFNGVTYASGLEAYTAKTLLENNINFEYEKSFTLINPFRYHFDCYEPQQYKKRTNFKLNNRILQLTYRPDFVGYKNGEISWVIECKGRQNERFPIVWKLFKMKMLLLPHPPTLMLPKNIDHVDKCIDIIKNI